jgi:hypothetical protein
MIWHVLLIWIPAAISAAITQRIATWGGGTFSSLWAKFAVFLIAGLVGCSAYVLGGLVFNFAATHSGASQWGFDPVKFTTALSQLALVFFIGIFLVAARGVWSRKLDQSTADEGISSATRAQRAMGGFPTYSDRQWPFPLLSFGMSRSFDLISAMPRGECVRRLQAATDKSAFRGSAPVIGHVEDKSLRLNKRFRGGTNSCQRYLYAKLSDENENTRLRCRFRLHPYTAVFSAILFGICFVILAKNLAAVLMRLSDGDDLSSENVWQGIDGPVVMLAMIFSITQIGLYLSRDEPDFLVDFLRDRIYAREA